MADTLMNVTFKQVQIFQVCHLVSLLAMWDCTGDCVVLLVVPTEL